MENKTIRYNGYIYGPKTRKGFIRMQRLGIPRPPFRTENKIYKTLRDIYRRQAAQMVRDFLRLVPSLNMTTDAAPNEHVDYDKLIKESRQIQKDFDTYRKLHPGQIWITRGEVEAAKNTLGHLWEELEGLGPDGKEQVQKVLERAYTDDQKEVLKEFMRDADERTARAISSFSIEKQVAFNDSMAGIKQLYLDNAMDRIDGELELLERAFLKRFTAYITGDTDTLKFEDIVKATFYNSDNMARMFARDQMARFNKALSLSTMINAGVTKVKWVTVGDGRVRRSHQELNGQVFGIRNLPEEIDDYNCRCALVPVEWAE